MDSSLHTPLQEAEKLARLRLYRTRNVGPVTFRRLLNTFESARAALDALPDMARRGGLRNLTTYPEAHAVEEFSAIDRIGGRALFSGEDDFPALLDMAEDAPPILMTLGDPAHLSRSSIAIVGARNASVNGRGLAETFAAELGDAGQLIISGMARGIDTAAHLGALPYGTIAVLAGGVDVIYPRENKDLHARIMECGTVVSEMAVGMTPQGRHFPRRNRIISGLSRGVVVVEAAERSGSLTTARFAGEQGREVLAVPGSPLDPRSHGTAKLIRDGATLVISSEQILEALGAPFERQLAPTAPQIVDVKTMDPPPLHTPILELLSHAPTPIDEIARHCDASTSAVRAVLLELELAGRIRCVSGNSAVLNRS